jgi:hypothetical protein
VHDSLSRRHLVQLSFETRVPANRDEQANREKCGAGDRNVPDQQCKPDYQPADAGNDGAPGKILGENDVTDMEFATFVENKDSP